MSERAKSMVFAAFVADSFALGTHWIYDTAKIDNQFSRITDLLPPHEGTYHPSKKLGDFTHYGDQSYHLLKHIVSHKGNFDIAEYSRDWHSFMTAYHGYKDKASKETLKNLDAGYKPDTCGSKSTDLGGPARIAPLIYCYRDDLGRMLTAVKDQTLLTHTGPGVVDGTVFLAESCHAILHGATPRKAFQQVLAKPMASSELKERLCHCLEQTDLSTRDQIKIFGQTCSINSALPGAVYAILKNEDSLEEALIETVMAGGDSAARGMAVGMILGAYLGKDKIPSHWLEKLTKYKKIIMALEELE